MFDRLNIFTAGEPGEQILNDSLQWRQPGPEKMATFFVLRGNPAWEAEPERLHHLLQFFRVQNDSLGSCPPAEWKCFHKSLTDQCVPDAAKQHLVSISSMLSRDAGEEDPNPFEENRRKDLAPRRISLPPRIQKHVELILRTASTALCLLSGHIPCCKDRSVLYWQMEEALYEPPSCPPGDELCESWNKNQQTEVSLQMSTERSQTNQGENNTMKPWITVKEYSKWHTLWPYSKSSS